METDRQGMTAAEAAMAGWIAHTFAHAQLSISPPEYGPNTIAMAKSAVRQLERDGFFVHRLDSEVHDHCDRDPGECSYEALRGEYDELRHKRRELARATRSIAWALTEVANGLGPEGDDG